MATDPDARIYADGSALSRYLDGAPFGAAWKAWADEHGDELVTSPLGLSELRGIARLRGGSAPATAFEVAGRVEVLRFSDQSVSRATDVAGVLPPFVALHAGTVRAYPQVTAVATYDVHLARVATLYGIRVVTPGREHGWWDDDPTPWTR